MADPTPSPPDAPTLPPSARTVLQVLQAAATPLGSVALALAAGLARSTVQRALAQLLAQGRVRRAGPDRSAPWTLAVQPGTAQPAPPRPPALPAAAPAAGADTGAVQPPTPASPVPPPGGAAEGTSTGTSTGTSSGAPPGKPPAPPSGPPAAPPPPASPAGKAPPFDPSHLDRAVIAAPLSEALQAWREGRSAEDLCRMRDGLFSVIVDVNINHPGGRERARQRVLDLLARVTLVARRDSGRTLRQAAGGALHQASDHYVFAWLSAEQIEALVLTDRRGPVQHRAVFRIWPDSPLQHFSNSRSLPTIKADAARATFGCTGRGIVWAVVDSGIDGQHPHFERHGNLRDLPPGVEHRDWTDSAAETTAGATPETAAPAATPTQAALRDRFGHGTHVAGILAGAWERGSGPPAQAANVERDQQDRPVTLAEAVHSVSGVAPECKLVSYKVLDDHGQGGVTSVIAALEEVLRVNGQGKSLRIHGVNLSLGYPFNPRWFACGHSPLCEVVNRLSRAGVFVVAAAGNTGYGYVDTVLAGTWAQGLPMSINDPGNAERAITVGSTHREAPHQYGVSYFSSKGPTGDGRCKPDLLAPGEKIVSANSTHQTREELKGMLFKEDSGTSMAAPHVSGAIAAFLSVRREFIGNTDDVKALFMRRAIDLRRDRSMQGAGLLDLLGALQAV